MKDGKLEVGDKVAHSDYGQWKEISEITRVTNTQAIALKKNYAKSEYEIKFRRDIDSRGYTRLIGSDSWNGSYQLLSEQISEQIKVQNIRTESNLLMRSIHIDKISLEDQKAIIQILSKYK